jgi:hypothetical protein
MSYRLAYAGYPSTAVGPPDPAEWVGPSGPPGPVGPQGNPGDPIDISGMQTTLPATSGVMWDNGGMVSIS